MRTPGSVYLLIVREEPAAGAVELQTNIPKVSSFTIQSHFTFKTLLRHYAKQASKHGR